MIVGSIIKTPYEAIDASVDFTSRLGTDTVSSFTVTAVTEDGSNVTSSIISTNPAPLLVGNVIKFRVIGGVAFTNYYVLVKIVAGGGQKFQGDISLQLRAY